MQNCFGRTVKASVKRATKRCNLFNEFKSDGARFAPTFKPVNNLICCWTGLMRMLKRAHRYSSSFCSNVVRQVRRQRGRAVRALDLQFEGPEFKSRSDRQLDLFSVVLSSNPRPHLWIAKWFSFRPVVILYPIVFDLNHLCQEFPQPHWH